MKVSELIEFLKQEDQNREIMTANIRFRDHDRLIASMDVVRPSKTVREKIAKGHVNNIQTGDKDGKSGSKSL